MLRYLIVCLLLINMASCRPPVFTPKPAGYFRIDTPDTHEYRLFDQPGFPYRFEYPAYATISRDTVFLGQKAENPYWININLPRFNGMINITYRPITPEFSLERLNEEAWGLSFFHHEKAEYINTKDFNNGRGVAGQLYIIGGNTATRYQFTATDSVRNFVRGALYFDVTPNADSLKPANDFLEQDIRHMLLTMQWK